ncbi:AAA family ATPase [Oscillochloris sp. ZM17-4]|uniref:AAA family ATPase n=1 Tax=Oscillochloris sp. ZM17-4 TaxID=2866714 RepID=UPI001C72E99F|nr:AAA family ATPase [Oscillochloris sp. ZM17-4]MBX0330561.1 AAA family ATPase [Oscillochloris sp. ZM17-4]
MHHISGYRLIEQVAEHTHCAIYRAHSDRDNRPVILKLLADPRPSPEDLDRFQREYAILRALDVPEVIRCYRMELVDRRPMLVLEDFGGTALSQLGLAGRLHIEQFLDIAIAIAASIGQVHQAAVIHKDINPANIVYNPATGELKLIDFSLATRLRREEVGFQSPATLEGTLAYLSPEQSGRMNRPVDYRTDLYSLGVTLYELATGRRPFRSEDPLELVHAHLARQPQPPQQLNPQLPPAVAAVIMKLLAKSADDRYQSAQGLRADLAYCREHLGMPEDLAGFVPGLHDRAERFQIPQALYGRDADVTQLVAAFARAADGGRELLLVSGPPGIGKTVLVHEIHRSVTARRGFFVGGKFDQLQRTVPYRAWAQVFTDLIAHLLTESAERLAAWQATIQAALGDSASVLIALIPNLELVLGPQPDAPPLEGKEAQSRLEFLLRGFVRALARPEHPLAIFLDDLQWADAASLSLLQLLLSEADTGSLLLIGAYRDAEVGPAHPLMMTIADIRQAGATITSLELQPLSRDEANQLIADTLACPTDLAQPFTNLLYQKTQGNPFFTTQLLQVLHVEHLITFDTAAGRWETDLAQVRAFALTDDAVAFLAQQLQKLPPETQALLALAACIGGQFDLATLALAAGRPADAVGADFWHALQMGLVLPTSERYQFRSVTSAEVAQQGTAQAGPTYHFLHDQVQQAAYSLLAESDRQATHLRIGRLLLEHTPEAMREARLFDIVYQLNQGRALLTEQSERDALARLNLRAGQKARAAAAFPVARAFFTTGLNLLDADGWRHDYELTLRLTEAAAEAAYLCGDFATMEQLGAVVLAEAHSVLDQIKVYEVMLQTMLAQNQLVECVQLGLRVLRQLGVDLPDEPGPADIGAALMGAQAAWQAQGITTLGDLPPMSDPTQLAAMRICSNVLPASFICSPALYVVLTFTEVSLSIQYGNTAISSHSYACCAHLLCGVFGDIETGHQFGQLAVDLQRRLQAKEFECKVESIVYAFVNHWKAPIRDSLLPIRTAHFSGLETGDYQFAGYAAVMYSGFIYVLGIEKDLAQLRAETVALNETIYRTRQMTSFQYSQMLRQAMHDLIEGRAATTNLQGDYYDEHAMLPQHIAANDRMGLFVLHSHKQLLNYHFGAYAQAVEDSAQAEQYLDAVAGFPYVPLFVVYDSLARIAAYRVGHGDAEEVQAQVEANQAKVAGWAQHAPMNWQHAWELVEAERQRVFGQAWEAMEAYDRAIAGARTHGFLREAALANELAAGFYQERGKEQLAQAHMQAAHAGYLRWGADAKAAQLEQRHAHWLAPDGAGHRAGPYTTSHTVSSTTSGAPLDLGSVIKASQAIAGEIALPRLLDRMIRIVIENAGAQRGALLLARGDGWGVAAYGEVDAPDIIILPEGEPPDSAGVSPGLVHYVARTRERVVLNDAAHTGAFTGDPVIQQRQAKSVLCAPLLNQGQVSGILYLENNLAAGAFTADRVELLTMLSAQMAMSLDNAHSYARLEAKVVERTRDLAKAKEVAERANDLKTKFLANMSHELRTPLNAILNFTRFLSKERYGTLSERQVELQQRVLVNAEHLLGLINDILDLSKIEAGKIDLHRDEVAVLPLLHGVMATAIGLTKDKELRLDLIAPEALPTVRIDKTRIRQVLLNLLSNAAKFTQQGGITVRASSDGQMLQVDVQDTGAGIAPEHQTLVFEEFRQIQDDSQPEQQGTGLGLPISKRLVEMHGGHLWLESTPGVGSTFSFTLPLAGLPDSDPPAPHPTPPQVA